MSAIELLEGRIVAGTWHGVLAAPGDTAPEVEVVHDQAILPDLSLTNAGGDRWQARLPIPSLFLSDGIQTFVVREAGTDRRLGHFTIVTGVPLEVDIRAEIELLRAELDMLKRAFRRHCVETGQDGSA